MSGIFAPHSDRAFGLKVFQMADTIQKYKDYVMTGFLKSVAPIVIERASGATVTDVQGREYLDRLDTGKHEFISLQASFHGRSWGALSVTGNYARKEKGGVQAAGISFAPAPHA